MQAWKKIENIKYNNCVELLFDLKKKNYKVSLWIEDIIKKYNYVFKDRKLPINLFRVKVSDFGISTPIELQEVYTVMNKKGYNLVPPEIAILSRTFYDDQPSGEWLRLATPLNSMIDSDGVPHLPKLGKALGFFFIETYWSYPKAIFHPHNEFIVIK